MKNQNCRKTIKKRKSEFSKKADKRMWKKEYKGRKAISEGKNKRDKKAKNGERVLYSFIDVIVINNITNIINKMLDGYKTKRAIYNPSIFYSIFYVLNYTYKSFI